MTDLEMTADAVVVVESLRDDYPLLFEMARDFDFAERLGGCTDPLMREIDGAMRELWLSRTNSTEPASQATPVGQSVVPAAELSKAKAG
jgi:hypothetical protein